METCAIRKGMLVECQQGVGMILAIDREMEMVLVEKTGTQQQLALRFDEIEATVSPCRERHE